MAKRKNNNLVKGKEVYKREDIHAPAVVDSNADIMEAIPDDINDRINEAIKDYMLNVAIPPIDDLKRVSGLVWTAVCMHIGKRAFTRDMILDKANTERRGCITYDYEKLCLYADIWASYTVTMGKAPLAHNFFYFVGVGIGFTETLTQASQTNPHALELRKKLYEIQETSCAQLLADGKQNPTGLLAILNHWHGWTRESVVIHQNGNKTVDADALPQIGAQ